MSGASIKKQAGIFKAFSPLDTACFRILDEQGRVQHPEFMPELSDDRLLEAYRLMLLARCADEAAMGYQRQGRFLTFAPGKGQEAAQVGSAMAVEKTDWIVPAYRELGAYLQHGMRLADWFLYFGGFNKGGYIPDGLKLLPITVPIASQLPHAAGLAWAEKRKASGCIVLAYSGDGSSSQGDFHEACNLASAWQAPLVFFVNNNQYAISVPFHRQTHSRTIAQKALAYDMPGLRVDGNDFLAVYAATREAAERARSGGGPSLIEALTYRLGPHTTSDDPRMYRSQDEENAWAARDPILRMRHYLEGRGLHDDTREAHMLASVRAEVGNAFDVFERQPAEPAGDIFKYMYAAMPPELKAQKASLEAYLAKEDTR